MAEEEANQLTYVPEVILKKRKGNEALALLRRKQLELGKHENKKRKLSEFKRPEQLIKEFRDKELDLVRMKQRGKRPRSALQLPAFNLLFIIRIQGKNEMHPKTKKILRSLRLNRIFDGVFMKVDEALMEMLQKVEPYVTYGCPNLKSVKELISKKGYGLINKQKVPLTDNIIIEEALGKYGMICLEDIIHQISTVGPHFKVASKFLGPLALNKPIDGLQGKKQAYKDGGDSGDRGDQINELINKMN
ncbi:60S ribosomal protein L7-1 [Tripterygium wilfordii]|uniref:60S ribosomal protein L7-1 n=1 Tax=Tripterygium wilfordii TaxID=458696 RepID=A0A7J7D629_TRIWF|nr:60S ribosomal protein L7-1-like [Tripterygium wilfordii]XP_038713927.1 60S ribosomal protein L7-1-like [Tripterygium wilfordii]XP_038713929.1 60S ribosomal protein L7-1-like [Tripterygium wilfordii]KAF5741772.1 60S ribosomal protein L7-1 [Tripterygium wilfordii]